MNTTLKPGSTGTDVRALQTLLNQRGARIKVDGWYGDATTAAVLAAQRRYGLVADGIAGPKTRLALITNDGGKWLKETDLERAADRLGVQPATVQAVNAVESNGCGFLETGHAVILFERHVFYQQLIGTFGHDFTAARAREYPAIVNTKRGGYRGGIAEVARLQQAMKIYTEGALASCSWGLFQIMGYHWHALGYASAQEFASRMNASEANQLDAFIRFIEHDPALHKALKQRKWDTFARLYNGPAWRENLYDVRLARAFEKFSTGDAVVVAEAGSDE